MDSSSQEKETINQEMLVSEKDMVNQEMLVSQKERENIIKNSFSSLSPLKARPFPAKQKKKQVVYQFIAERIKGELLQKDETYTERQINDILGEITDDYVVLRRALVDMGQLFREKDGSKYWI
jgi:hypothetical protein